MHHCLDNATRSVVAALTCLATLPPDGFSRIAAAGADAAAVCQGGRAFLSVLSEREYDCQPGGCFAAAPTVISIYDIRGRADLQAMHVFFSGFGSVSVSVVV